jgi:hypothetical protein
MNLMLMTQLSTLHLAATASTPLVLLNAAEGHCVLHGRTMPLDPARFFEPIIKWVNSYALNPSASTSVSIKVDYFNSGASLMLTRLVQQLNWVPNAKVYWYYHPDDETILEAGRDFARFAKIPFLLVEDPQD